MYKLLPSSVSLPLKQQGVYKNNVLPSDSISQVLIHNHAQSHTAPDHFLFSRPDQTQQESEETGQLSPILTATVTCWMSYWPCLPQFFHCTTLKMLLPSKQKHCFNSQRAKTRSDPIPDKGSTSPYPLATYTASSGSAPAVIKRHKH